MAKAGTIRGLQMFISDIRACQNREQEKRRVDRELAKVRSKFGDDKKGLSPYERKKYVWKLLYIYMLGYDVEFGHRQACDLIPAPKYSEKQVGYMACSILMNEHDEFLRLSINAIHSDLVSRNEAFQCLALTFVANIAGPEMAEALTPDVLKLLGAASVRPIVRKKAALCLLRLLRKTAADQQVVTPETFAPVAAALLEERDIGLLLAAATLLQGVVTRCGPAGYEACGARALRQLERLVALRDVTPDYTYYGIASPWLQVKCLRLLQLLPPPEAPAAQKALRDTLHGIFNMCGDHAKSPTVNKANAQNAILFEAISLCLALDAGRDLLQAAVGSLARFLSVKEPNVRYLALETLTRLALLPSVNDAVVAHQAAITASLRDPDVSIRRRALDLLFTMADAGTAPAVVEELVKYLTVADFSMREELVLKVAVLAERFAPDTRWYVDVMLSLLERAGDFCSDDIWHRAVQLVTNNPGMQAYAAERVVEVLRRGAGHEALLCAAACILGEYGRLITPGTSALSMFQLLAQHAPELPPPARALLLSASLKLLLLAPGDAALAKEVGALLERQARCGDAELQQRAVEYLALAKRPDAAAASFVLPMPKWEGRESALLRRVQLQLQVPEGADSDAASLSSALTPAAAGDDTAASRSASRVAGAPAASGGGLGLPPPPPPAGGAAPLRVAVPSGDGGGAGVGTPRDNAPLAAEQAGAVSAAAASSGQPASNGAQGAAATPKAAAPKAATPKAATPKAAPPAAAAPIIDLLGDDFGAPPPPAASTTAAGAVAGVAAAAAAGAAAGAGAAVAAPRAADPLDELFGGLLVTQPAAAPTPAAPALAAPAAAPSAVAGPLAAAAGPQVPSGPAAAASNGGAHLAPAAAQQGREQQPEQQQQQQPPLPHAAFTGASGPSPFAPGAADAACPPTLAAATAAASGSFSHGAFGAPSPGLHPAYSSGSFSSPAPPPAGAPGGPPGPSHSFGAGGAVGSGSFSSPAYGMPGAPQPYAPPPYAPSPLGGGHYGGGYAPQLTGAPYAPQLTGAPYAPQMTGGYMMQPTGGYLPQATGGAYGAPPPVQDAAAAWYTALLLRDQGVLYEDALIHVSLASRYTGARCDATLLVANRHPAAPLAPLALAAASHAPGALQVTLGQAPPALAPGQHAHVPLTALALTAPPEPPLLHLSYGVPGGAPGQTVAVTLRLPIVAHKFMAPEPSIAKEAFFATWKRLSGPPHKQQEMVERPPHLGPLSPDATAALLRGANFGVTRGALDPNPHNDAGAANFTAGPPGAEARTLCQCRVEGNPQNRLQFRVTVAAPDAALAAAVMGALAALIRGAPPPA